MINPFIVICFFAFILIIGLSQKKISSVTDYIYSGRKVTAPALIATLVTTWYGGINEIGLEVIHNGIVTWVYFGLVYYVSAFFYAYIIAPKIVNKNYSSIPIAIYKNYGKIPAIISLIVVFMYLLPASYLIILGQLINQIFDINNIYTSIFIGLIVSTIYTLKGGFSSIIQTDKVQFIFMFLGFFILSLYLFLSENYGINIIYDLYNREPIMFEIPGKRQWSFIGVFALLSLATFIDPSFHQRTFAGKNIKTVQRSILWAILFWFIFDFMTITSALFYYQIAYMKNIDILSVGAPYIELAKIVFKNSSLFLTIFFISILSVVMSTIDSYTFLSSVTLNYDLNKILGKNSNINTIKKTTIIVLVLSFILSTIFSRALDYWYYFGSFMIVSIFIPMICALFEIKIKNVTLMMVLPIIVVIIWEILILGLGLTFPSIYIGLLISFGIFIISRK